MRWGSQEIKGHLPQSCDLDQLLLDFEKRENLVRLLLQQHYTDQCTMIRFLVAMLELHHEKDRKQRQTKVTKIAQIFLTSSSMFYIKSLFPNQPPHSPGRLSELENARYLAEQDLIKNPLVCEFMNSH